MPDDSPACSEEPNSTNCLLSALLNAVEQQSKQQADEFNWDPLSFGFTAPIGILAAIFTLLTVIQMVLAAGSGRRRSNEQVIGPWSTRRKKYWSWTEFRMLTIAPTPVLRALDVRLMLTIAIRAPPEPKDARKVALPYLPRRLSSSLQSATKALASPLYLMGASALFSKLRRREETPAFELLTARTSQSSRARWLVHFSELGLDELFFEKGDFEMTAADYLPDDIQAVPAYAEVGCLVSLVAASCISSIKPDTTSPYPLIIGKGFQLSFRDHPRLGCVAVFSRHGVSQGKPHPATRTSILWALYWARGEVAAPKVNAVSSREFYQVGDLARLSCACAGKQDGRLCSMGGLQHEKNKHVLWLLAASSPWRAPQIFPSRAAKLHEVLTIFMLQSRSLVLTGGSRLPEHIRSLLPSAFGSSRVFWIDEAVTVLRRREFPEGMAYYRRGVERREEDWPGGTAAPRYPFILRDGVCGAMVEMFQLCLQFLYDPDDFMDWWRELDDSRAAGLQTTILVQIQQLEDLLAAAPHPRLVECQKLTVYLTTQAFFITEQHLAGQTLDVARLVCLREEAETPSTVCWDSQDMPRLGSQHEPTIRALDAILSPVTGPKSPELDKELGKQQRRLRTILAPWYSADPDAPCPAREALLQRLRRMVEARGISQSAARQAAEGDQGPWIATEEETIHEILLWRTAFFGMMFYTAPDNSDLLESGLWRHVIPYL